MTKGSQWLAWVFVIFFGGAYPGLIVGQTVTVSPEKAAEAIQHYQQAKILDHKGSTEEACVEYRRAVDLDPQFGKAHLMKGVCFDRAGNEPSAMSEYQMALGLDMDRANTAITHYDLGNLYSRRGKKPLAIREYQLALAADPSFQDARWALQADQSPNALVSAGWNLLMFLNKTNYPVFIVMLVAFLALYPLTRIKEPAKHSSEKPDDQIVAAMQTGLLSDQQIKEFDSRKKKIKHAAIFMVIILLAIMAVPNSYLRDRGLSVFIKDLLFLGLVFIFVSYRKRLQRCPSCDHGLPSVAPVRCSSCGVKLSTGRNAGQEIQHSSQLPDERIREFQSRRGKVRFLRVGAGVAAGLFVLLFSCVPVYHVGRYLPFVIGASVGALFILYMLRLLQCPSCGERLPSLDVEHCPECGAGLR